MTNANIALAYALLQGFKKVEFLPQPWEHPDFKDCDIFEAYNKDIEDETIMFVVVKDGYTRHITTQEEYDVIWDITFPPCL